MDYPGLSDGPSIVTNSLKEGSYRVRVRKRYDNGSRESVDDVWLPASTTEEGITSKEMWAASRNRKGKVKKKKLPTGVSRRNAAL